MGSPVVETEQDCSIRVDDLPEVVVGGSRLRQAKQRLVPLESLGHVSYADDRPRALYGSLCGISARSTNPQVPRRGFTPIRDQLEFDRLSLIETSETSAVHCRDVNEHVLAAALRLDEAVTLGRIEPFHGTCGHLSLLRSSIAAVRI